MKITSISAIPAAPDAVPNPFNFPPWNFVFVKVETDEGWSAGATRPPDRWPW